MNNYSILSVSDIHLGHKRNSTADIIKNLNKYITNEKTMVGIDLMFIAGDLFDSQLSLDSEDVGLIDRWISKLLKLCQKHNVTLRVLEGTPSHDRNQSKRFIIIKDILKDHIEVDVKYIDSLSVEYIEKFNINVLYVPDEWNHSTDLTFKEAQEIIVSKGLDKVDYAVCHFTFDFQLPGHVKNIPKHDRLSYESLVNNLIFVGHIHQHSITGKVIAHGSFDRLAHGEEEAKGFVKVHVSNRDQNVIEFIENKEAKLFKTFNAFDENIDEVYKRIDSKVNKLKEDSFIRLRCKQNSIVSSSLGVFKTKYPIFHWSIITENDSENNIILVDDTPLYVPIIINKNNISSLIEERMIKQGTEKEIMSLALNQLELIKEKV
jgi:DNA repair exonuclease SbcCD nuclease subunit